MKNTLLLLFCTVFPFAIFSQSLSGNYTVNASLPSGNGNYQSFSTLADDLNNFGVSGPVNVVVAPGTYQDSLHLQYIQGSSSTNTITIDGQDSSLAILQHSGQFIGQNVNATIVLDSTEYINIKNLGIHHSDSNVGLAIYMTDYCRYNSIMHCDVQVNPGNKPVIPLFAFQNIVIANMTGTSAYVGKNLIINNRISGGYFGINLVGNGNSNLITGNKIIGNNFINISELGIVCSYQDSLEIKNNNIQVSTQMLNNGTAIELNFSSNISIIGNNIKSYKGIYVSSVSEKIELSNNMIICNAYGIGVSRIDSMDIYHNSISSIGPALDIRLITSPILNSFDIRNNIFRSEKAQAIKSNVNDSFLLELDNNIYYSNNPYVISIDENNYRDLDSYRQVSPQFNNFSMQVHPNFISDTSNLHLTESFAFGKGDPSVGSNVDIDGDPRPFPGSSHVTIGADEFLPQSNNAKIEAWENKPICAGTYQTKIKIANWGSDSIHHLWLVYSNNGVMDSVYFNTPIPPSDTRDVALNPINFIADSIYQFEFYSKLPNGLPDAVPSNDTLYTEIRTGLSGNYSIDSFFATSSTNFQSFENMASILTKYGVCGPTTINVSSGSGPYNNLVYINGIPGADPNNTVTINGNGETIQHRLLGPDDRRGVINLENTSYFILDSLSIYMNCSDSLNDNSRSGEFASAIHILNGSHHLTINNCNLIIDSNNIETRAIAASNTPNNYINSSGLNRPYGNAYAITISNNKIHGQNLNNFAYGIFSRYQAENPTGPSLLSINNVITNNEISSIGGIYLESHDSLFVENNIIQGFLYQFNHYGIFATEVKNSLLNGNIIRNSDIIKGIALLQETFSNSFYINNLISNTRLRATDGGNAYFYNNTASLTDTPVNSEALISGIGMKENGVYLNNLVYIGGNGNSDKVGLILMEQSLNIPFTSNYNNVYIPSTGQGSKYYGGYFDNRRNLVGFSTLSSWQSNSNQDANSMSVDPQFANPAAGDFTPTNQALNGSGTPIPQVTEDLYGNPRVGNPDIGAIEVGNPVGIMEEDGSTFMVFPNPSTGKFTMVATPNNKESFHLSLWDMNGKKLFEKNLSISNSHLEDLDFSEFQKGMYLLKMTTEDEEKTEKLIIR